LYNNYSKAVLKDLQVDENILHYPKIHKSFSNLNKQTEKKIMNVSSFGLPQLSQEELTKEKMNYIYFLITPRIVFLKHFNKSVLSANSTPFVFKLTPTNDLFTFRIEYYIIELQSSLDNSQVELFLNYR
jgi:hypothetical protein